MHAASTALSHTVVTIQSSSLCPIHHSQSGHDPLDCCNCLLCLKCVIRPRECVLWLWLWALCSAFPVLHWTVPLSLTRGILGSCGISLSWGPQSFFFSVNHYSSSQETCAGCFSRAVLVLGSDLFSTHETLSHVVSLIPAFSSSLKMIKGWLPDNYVNYVSGEKMKHTVNLILPDNWSISLENN